MVQVSPLIDPRQVDHLARRVRGAACCVRRGHFLDALAAKIDQSRCHKCGEFVGVIGVNADVAEIVCITTKMLECGGRRRFPFMKKACNGLW